MAALFVAAAALTAALGTAYFIKKESWPLRASLTLKAGCTLVPVLLALIGILWFERGGTHWILFAGLCLCLLADVAIGLQFVAGMAVFALAHFCFIGYFVSLHDPQWPSAVLFATLYAGIVLFFLRYARSLGKKVIPFALYPAVLCGMVSLAAALPVLLPNQRTGASLLCAGAVLFTVSDLLLAYNVVVKYSRVRDAAVLLLYFSGVGLLGASVFFR